jgi:hypothetical protein
MVSCSLPQKEKQEDMAPDARHHRGAHPADHELFKTDQLAKLRLAVAELSWLLSRDYKMTSSLKLVGDRHALRERQRLAVSRSACSDQNRQRRHNHRVPFEQLRNGPVIIDGFNLIITIEAALSGGPLLIGADQCIRDLSSVHGSYRTVQETERAILIIGQALETLGTSSALWLLDRPVSNSGRLATRINELARQHKWPWTVEVVLNPDSILTSATAVAITSDSAILDGVQRWVDLKSYVLKQQIAGAWMIDLSETPK